TLPILDAVGATPAIERHGFLEKPGGTFLWGRRREPWSFWFREDPGGRPHAYQVVRAEFDQLLLENARAHGAEVHEEHAVTAVDARRWHALTEGDPEGTYRGLIARCPAIAERLARAAIVSPVRIIRDYSYTSTRFTGPGFLLAGDAACFIDPVFSTGVHLACL